jgi:hypothetical protein
LQVACGDFTHIPALVLSEVQDHASPPFPGEA